MPKPATPAWVEGIVHDFWSTSPANSLYRDTDEKAWDVPIFGYSRGDDPYYRRFKEEIGPFYWTPEEIFNRTFPGQAARPEELTIICYVLPQTAATRRDQRREETFPSERWARSRWRGEMFNCDLRLHLAETISGAGYPAMAPERDPEFDYRRSERFGIASNWSERHAAFISGLGTFGLSDGLITPHGKAVRIGSVVAKMSLPPTPRPYPNHQAWCLYYARNTCGACVLRCPVDAITTGGGHDKDTCRDYVKDKAAKYATEHYGTGATPCGLCQVRIPCESRIPAELLAKENKPCPT